MSAHQRAIDVRRTALLTAAFALSLMEPALAAQPNDLEKAAFEAYPLARLLQGVVKSESTPHYTRLGRAEEVLKVPSSAAKIIQASGYDADIYKNKETGALVLAHKGSDWITSPEAVVDWAGNISQARGYPTFQTNVIAPTIAREAKRYDPNILCVGHSLGGANAFVGCGSAGLKVITFNPAGLNSLNERLARGVDATTYRIGNDPASMVGKIPGATIDLPAPPGMNRFQTHSIDAVVAELSEFGTRYERRMLQKSGLNSDDNPELSDKIREALEEMAVGPSTGLKPAERDEPVTCKEGLPYWVGGCDFGQDDWRANWPDDSGMTYEQWMAQQTAGTAQQNSQGGQFGGTDCSPAARMRYKMSGNPGPMYWCP